MTVTQSAVIFPPVCCLSGEFAEGRQGVSTEISLLTVFGNLGLEIAVWFAFEDWTVDKILTAQFVPCCCVDRVANVIV